MRSIGTSNLGYLLLVLVSILWGTSFPLIKMVTASIDANEYVAFRFILTVFILSPYFVYVLLKKRNEFFKVAKPGVILGLMYFGGIFFQGLGTKYTTASNSGFITSLYIPIVYVIDVLNHRLNYSHRFTLALFLSMLGIYLISGGYYELRIGDLIVLISAFFWAFQILAIDKFSKEGFFSLDLVFFQYAVTALLGSVSASSSLNLLKMSEVFFPLLYLAVVCSILVGVLQIIGQRYTTASQASLIYVLEPVFAALFSFVLLGERLNVPELAGAFLILCSVLISSWEATRVKTD
ncbi:MAG: DMT family transporter [Candidatus Brockarchaeota archaeon]|nr:DMT family transporter [Candidatus Brockarchaeota archaeon]